LIVRISRSSVIFWSKGNQWKNGKFKNLKGRFKNKDMRRKVWSEVANDFGGYVSLREQVGMILPGK